MSISGIFDGNFLEWEVSHEIHFPTNTVPSGQISREYLLLPMACEHFISLMLGAILTLHCQEV